MLYVPSETHRTLLSFSQRQVNKSDYSNVMGALPYLKVNKKADYQKVNRKGDSDLSGPAEWFCHGVSVHQLVILCIFLCISFFFQYKVLLDSKQRWITIHMDSLVIFHNEMHSCLDTLGWNFCVFLPLVLSGTPKLETSSQKSKKNIWTDSPCRYNMSLLCF